MTAIAQAMTATTNRKHGAKKVNQIHFNIIADRVHMWTHTTGSRMPTLPGRLHACAEDYIADKVLICNSAFRCGHILDIFHK